jgi:hypothetical protein
MTANPGAGPVPFSWIDTEPAHLIDAAIDIIRSDDPDAWKLFGSDQSPRYALWAYLIVGHADTLPFPAVMDSVEELSGPAGQIFFQAGLAPAETATILGGDEGQQPSPRPGRSSRDSARAVQLVEVDE